MFFLVVSTRSAYLVYPLGFISFNHFTIQFYIELKRIYSNFSQLLLLTRYGKHTYLFMVSSQLVVSILRCILYFILLGSFFIIEWVSTTFYAPFSKQEQNIFLSENTRNDISFLALHLCLMGNSNQVKTNQKNPP